MGLFVSSDPIFDASSPQSMNPYSYSLNNPTTMSDPSGMTSSYAWGLQQQNSMLRAQNRQLINTINLLNGQLQMAQDIIRQQADAINQLLTQIDAMAALIEQMTSYIHQLEARVAYLQGVVARQQAEIGRLRAQNSYYRG